MWPFRRKRVAPTAEGRFDMEVQSGRLQPRRFEVLEKIEGVQIGEVQQRYRPGLTYQVREGNDELARRVQSWVEAGKARWLPGSERKGVGAWSAPSRIEGKVS